MTRLHQEDVPVESPDRFRGVLAEPAFRRFREALDRGRERLAGRTLWNVNSTAEGGGVAEMIRALLPYPLGASWEARWVVIEGDPEFFRITKRLHNMLHGSDADGPVGPRERARYEATTARNARALEGLVRPGDVVLVHDPQTAGLIGPLTDRGAHVIWQCHVGTDHPTGATHRAWDFLRPYVEPAERYVFSRPTYMWDGLDEGRMRVVPPSISAFTAKNQDLARGTVDDILRTTGVLNGGPAERPSFTRHDGTEGAVRRRVDRVGGGPPVPSDAPIVLKVSRWDRLKDPAGAIRMFAGHLAHRADVHFVFAGPEVDGVSDDPEGEDVLRECRELWRGLPDDVAERVHLLSVPTDDTEENAAIVNALQRRADVVVQKSLQEGFGLVVAEAMWKERPTVASRVGGIQDQIEHDRSGILVDDPSDLEGFGRAVAFLIDDPDRASRLGEAARRRVSDRFLGSRQLVQYVELIEELV